MRVIHKNIAYRFLLLGVLILYLYLTHVLSIIPYIGLDVKKNDLGTWQISDIDNMSWSAAQDIQVGDIVMSVNQLPADDYPTIKKFQVIEQAELFSLKRNEELLFYHVSKKLNYEQIIYHSVIPKIFFSLLFIFSISLYMKKRDDKSAIILIFFFMAVGFSYLSAGASVRGDLIARFTNLISLLFTPVLFLHFLFYYFSPYNIHIISHRLIKIFYWFNGLFILVKSVFTIVPYGTVLPVLRIVQLSIVSIDLCICLSILLFNYIRYRRTVHKSILKIFVIGTFFAFFPFMLFSFIPKIVFGEEYLPGAWSAASLLMIPIIFMYLVMANRLPDIEFIINRIRYYGILALLPAAIIIPFAVYINKQSSTEQLITTSLAGYIVLVAFLYLKDTLNSHFRSKLSKEIYNFQSSLDQFYLDIMRIMKASDLEERFLAEIKAVLDIESVSLLEIEETELLLRFKKGHSEYPELLIINHFKNKYPVISVGMINDIRHGIYLTVGKNKCTHYLVWINEKKNRIQINRDERVWLKTVAQYVSLVYENLYLIEQLEDALEEALSQKKTAPAWMLRFIFNLSEKERRRLALDLHDSALQEQLFLYQKLKKIINHQELQEEIKLQLICVNEGLLDVIEQIRETCNELRPPFLNEIGIVEALEDLLTQVRLRTNLVVHFDVSHFNADLSQEQTLAIYRIVQELLRNATRHSSTSKVDMELSVMNQHIFFHYRDYGVGMNLEQYRSSFDHIGLHGIEERVACLDGETQYRSTPGNGFEVSIRMPLTIRDNQFENMEDDPRDSNPIG